MVKIAEKLKRSWAHLSANPFQSSWLNRKARERISQAVTEGEKAHSGEIRVVIEKSLPMSVAWKSTARERAIDVFSHFRVWDTVERSGVLIYLNLAERRLEIVADSGIDAVVEEDAWQELADQAVARLYDKRPVEALERLISGVADLLRTHYGKPEDPAGNELPDAVVVI